MPWVSLRYVIVVFPDHTTYFWPCSYMYVYIYIVVYVHVSSWSFIAYWSIQTNPIEYSILFYSLTNGDFVKIGEYVGLFLHQ